MSFVGKTGSAPTASTVSRFPGRGEVVWTVSGEGVLCGQAAGPLG